MPFDELLAALNRAHYTPNHPPREDMDDDALAKSYQFDSAIVEALVDALVVLPAAACLDAVIRLTQELSPLRLRALNKWMLGCPAFARVAEKLYVAPEGIEHGLERQIGEPRAPEPDGWIYSEREVGFDDFHGPPFPTREAALAAARADESRPPGAIFQTGLRVTRREAMPNPVDAASLIDVAENLAWDEDQHDFWADRAGDPEVIADLQARLDRVWDEWTANHKLAMAVEVVDDVVVHAPEAP